MLNRFKKEYKIYFEKNKRVHILTFHLLILVIIKHLHVEHIT